MKAALVARLPSVCAQLAALDGVQVSKIFNISVELEGVDV